MSEQTQNIQTKYLFVDLDGTFVHEDTFWVSVKALLRTAPWWVFVSFLRLPWGRAAVKAALGHHWLPSLSQLTREPSVFRLIEIEKRKGKRIYLATGANEQIAKKIAAEAACFDGVLASRADLNLTGSRKLEAMQALSGGEIEYVGDSSTDLPIFEACSTAYLVSKASGLKSLISHSRVVILE